jgi:lipopolysaccharide biosynthesis regulator YciM
MKQLKQLLECFAEMPTEKQQKALNFLSGLIEKETDEEIKNWLIQLKTNLETKQNGGAR